MKKILIPFLTAFLALAVCGCEDESGGLQEAAPRVESYFVGDPEQIPGPDDFLGMNESGELEIHFGEVDVGVVARRLLFVQNTGKSDLKLFSMQMESGSSPDFLVACLDGGDYRDNCPYSDTDPLEIKPGQNLVVQVSAARRGPRPATIKRICRSTSATRIWTPSSAGTWSSATSATSRSKSLLWRDPAATSTSSESTSITTTCRASWLRGPRPP